MRFSKMEAAGNDYVLVEASELPAVDLGVLARRLSDRRTGIGSDGLIVVRSSARAAARMEMYNADGTRSAMCGNGLRLVAKLVAERAGPGAGSAMRIESDAGVHRVELRWEGSAIVGAAISMGTPAREAHAIPVQVPRGVEASDGWLRLPFDVEGFRGDGVCLSIGNPHVVFFVPTVAAAPVAAAGPRIENDPRFPDRTNATFVEVVSAAEIRTRTWERGAGETRSCGSGACAAAVASVVAGRTGRRVDVHQTGGSLHVEWSPEGEVILAGAARTVFTGEWPHGSPSPERAGEAAPSGG